MAATILASTFIHAFGAGRPSDPIMCCEDQAESDLKARVDVVESFAMPLVTQLMGRPYAESNEMDLAPSFKIVCPAWEDETIQMAFSALCSPEYFPFWGGVSHEGVREVCVSLEYKPMFSGTPFDKTIKKTCKSWEQNGRPVAKLSDVVQLNGISMQEDGSYISQDLAMLINALQGLAAAYTATNAFGLCQCDPGGN